LIDRPIEVFPRTIKGRHYTDPSALSISPVIPAGSIPVVAAADLVAETHGGVSSRVPRYDGVVALS
jgi:hypothetical protein